MSGNWQKQQERGAGWAIAFLFWVARHLGRPLARVVAFFPVLWFFLTGSAARAAVRDYLARVQPQPVRHRDVWHQFARFGMVALDRIFLLAGSSGYRNRVTGDAMVEATVARGGALLFVAHFGSFESMRVVGARQKQLPLAILMDRAIGAMFTSALERVDPELAANVIDASQGGPSLVLKLKEALAAGKLVGIMADRARGAEATLAVDFLGSPAHFPLSPWQLALALKCPVILGFSIARGQGRYESYFELFSTGFDAPRAARQQVIAEAVQGYAARLEHWVRQAPDNWFNFYPFWATPKPDDATPR